MVPLKTKYPDTVLVMPPTRAKFVLVVSKTTVVSEPDKRVVVTGTTMPAVVDEFAADGVLGGLAVRALAGR